MRQWTHDKHVVLPPVGDDPWRGPATTHMLDKVSGGQAKVLRCTPLPACPADTFRKHIGTVIPQDPQPALLPALETIASLAAQIRALISRKIEWSGPIMARVGHRSVPFRTSLTSHAQVTCEP
jgi:hypothetical protein